jgi:Signal transduction histidine kinase
VAIIDKIQTFFKVSEKDREIIKNDIRDENIKRIFYLSLIGAPVSFLHVILFSWQLHTNPGVEDEWRTSILVIHAAITLLLIAISTTIYFSFYTKKRNVALAQFCVLIVTMMLMIGGGIISAVDQLITTAINPFIVVSFIASIVLLIKPLHALLYYSGSFLFFYFFMMKAQPNPEVLISNQVNGLTFTGVGLCLSFIFWKTYLARLKQHKLIESQKNELIANYNKLKFYSDELKESNTTKDKLLSVIGHDLRSPLASLINVTKLLSDNYYTLEEEEVKDLLAALNKESELTLETLNNLLLWSKTQRQKLIPAPVNTKLTSLISNTFYQVESLLSQKNITFINEVQESIEVYVDPSMMQSVLKNLVINAIKFTNTGGRITISAKLKPNSIEISVQDTGIGMSQETIDKLFNSTIEFTTRGTHNEKGTGLGLQICKEFIALNGGQFRAESEIGVGTTFHVEVPSKK